MHYKRIFEINPLTKDDMFAEKPFGIILRPAKNGGPNEYAASAVSPHDRYNVDNLVNKYAID